MMPRLRCRACGKKMKYEVTARKYWRAHFVCTCGQYSCDYNHYNSVMTGKFVMDRIGKMADFLEEVIAELEAKA